MKIALSVVVVLGLVVPIRAEEAKKSTYEVETVKNVVYDDAKDADAERHKLDLYLPRGAKDYPVFFFVHGGGWQKGSKAGFEAHGKTFARHGVGFVAVNYRLSPAVKHPAHVEDVAKAFAWSVANLGKRGANVKQIYISGHSAGGHLAALLGSDEKYLQAHKLSLSNVRGVIPISGVFLVTTSRLGKVFGDEESSKGASPLTHVKAKLPPFLVFYGDAEKNALGKQAETFGEAMGKVKADIVVKSVADRDHGSIMRKASNIDDEMTTQIFAFIRKHGGLKDDK